MLLREKRIMMTTKRAMMNWKAVQLRENRCSVIFGWPGQSVSASSLLTRFYSEMS